MQEKSTGEVEKMLKDLKPNQVEDFLKANRQSMVDEKKAFYYYVKSIVEEKGVKLKDMYIGAGVPESYGEKIIRMEKHTKNRDVIIRLCVAGHFSVDETSKALKLYGMNPLYSKDRRDAVLIVAMNHRMFELFQIDDLLEQNGLEKLSQDAS